MDASRKSLPAGAALLGLFPAVALPPAAAASNRAAAAPLPLGLRASW